MNKLLISSVVLIIYSVVLCTSDVIPVAVNSHRQFDVETVNLDETDPQNYSPHVFEIEPSTSPLRIVFSSESSPLSLEVEKVFRETPIHAAPAPDVKQDRSGVIGPDARPVNSAAEASPINEEEYEIVDSYSRYVPVKVRDNTEQVAGSDDDVVFIKPEKVIKIGKAKSIQSKAKKVVKVPVIKVTTAKPSAKVVATKATTKPVTNKPTAKPTKTTPAEELTTPAANADDKGKAKFGARLTRQTKKAEKKEQNN